MSQHNTIIQDKIRADRRRWLSLLAKGGALAGLARTSTLAAGVLANRLAEAQGELGRKFLLIYHPGGAPRNYLNTIAVRPFEPLLDKVAVLTMTINTPGNHGLIFRAAGANSFNPADLNSSTIDQQIADTIGHLTPLRSMELGVVSGNYEGLIRYRGQAVSRINSPDLALQRYWRELPVSVPYAAERRKALIAAHQQGLDKILSQISVEERFKLEAHIGALERFQNRLDTRPVTGDCGTVDYTKGETPLNLYRAQGDIAVTALACGLTNVASIQFNSTYEDWLPNDGTADAVPVAGDHGQVLNSGSFLTFGPAVNEYMNKGVAHIINKLIAAGIYQDTVVLCLTEMGNSTNNTPEAGPITLASGIAGLKVGKRNLNKDHYEIFPDVVRLMGLEWAQGQTIYKYSGGGLVV
jgi:hypothetical protein